MKKAVTSIGVAVVVAVCGVAVVRAATAPPNGTVRGLVALVGDSNIVIGSTSLAGKMTPAQVGYVPLILSAGGATIRWNGCVLATPCPDPALTDYWATRIAQARQRVNPDAYVLELGINDTGTLGTATSRGYASYDQKVDYMMRLLPSNRPVLWTTLPCAIEPAARHTGCLAVNTALLGARARWPNLTIADWGAVANPHPEYMNQPGTDVHYSEAGYDAFALFVVDALNAKVPISSTKPVPVVPPVVAQAHRSGYWMVDRGGRVYAFGAAAYLGGARTEFATHIEATPTRRGYWIVNARGQVYAFGDARWKGNATGLASGESVTSLSRTLSGRGYWLFTNTGRVLAFGDATFFGDMSGVRLNGPVVGSVATPTAKGYYMVASDGGIFSFGDARFHGSMGGARLNQPVNGLVPTESNRGYWLSASDGGVFSFGDAAFRGSMGRTHLNQPVIGMARFGDGYLMVASDGGIFDFSNQPFAGSLGTNPPADPIVGVASAS